MNIGQVLNSVYDEEVGWRPASGSIKPVHVANGLVRSLSGKYFDTGKIVDFLVWWRSGDGPNSSRSFATLVKDDATGVFEGFRDAAHQFERARRYAQGILGADKAVFPSADNSCLTLTCPQMASRSNNDRGLGDFAAAIIRGRSGNGPLAKALARVLRNERPSDPVTVIVWPLLHQDGREVTTSNRVTIALRRKHHDKFLAQLEAAAETLATHEHEQENRLRTLQRGVHFACVATHAHAQTLAANGDLAKRVPALISAGSRRRTDVGLASEKSLDFIYEQFERWLGDREGDRIRAGKPLVGEGERIDATSDGRTARKILASIGTAKKPHSAPDEDVLKARMADFEDIRREKGKDDPALVIGHALVSAYIREYESGGPRRFLLALGRKAGLLYPHFQGRTREKRVHPSVSILDMLVRACVRRGDHVPLDDFLGRLWERFGLVVGGRRNDEWDDGELLRRNRILVDQSALVDNTSAFVSQLVAMGLARKYADNVTFIGVGSGS